MSEEVGGGRVTIVRLIRKLAIIFKRKLKFHVSKFRGKRFKEGAQVFRIDILLAVGTSNHPPSMKHCLTTYPKTLKNRTATQTHKKETNEEDELKDTDKLIVDLLSHRTQRPTVYPDLDDEHIEDVQNIFIVLTTGDSRVTLAVHRKLVKQYTREKNTRKRAWQRMLNSPDLRLLCGISHIPMDR